MFLLSRKYMSMKINTPHALWLNGDLIYLPKIAAGCQLTSNAGRGAAGWASWTWAPAVTQVLHLVGLQSLFTALLSPS